MNYVKNIQTFWSLIYPTIYYHGMEPEMQQFLPAADQLQGVTSYL